MSNDDLSAGSVGTVIRPGDSEWESARRFHSGIGEPAAVIRAASVDDVRGAVRYAAAERLDIMIRGGGHSAWGGVPGGLTLDISALDAVEVDGTRVRIGGGALWGGVAHALAERGLGLSSGDTASVGVGGLTLGGGIGWMVRAWGLAADQLVGAQLVTARGDVVEVTETSHPELLWALRGGGGNFGVVTRFDFEAHPLDGVVHAVYGLEGDARPVLRVLADVLADAPRELTVTYMDVPAMDPSAPAGASITAVWAGTDEDAARRALAPLGGCARRHREGVRRAGLPRCAAGGPRVRSRTADARLRRGEHAARGARRRRHRPPRHVPRAASRLRGAAALARRRVRRRRAGRHGVPRARRDVVRDGRRVRHPGHARRRGRVQLSHAEWDAIEAKGSGVYGNFTVSTDEAIAQRMYPPATMARLAAIKHTWDPGNMFCRNHNVKPVPNGHARLDAAAQTPPRADPRDGDPPSVDLTCLSGVPDSRQWVSSASISVRSPDHSVWKVPSLSMRL